MPTSFMMIRLVLAFLAAGFALMLGRCYVLQQRGRVRVGKTIGWGFRTFAALAAVLWTSRKDAIAIGAMAAVVVALAIGFYLEWRPKYRGGKDEEDLTEVMFPPDDGSRGR